MAAHTEVAPAHRQPPPATPSGGPRHRPAAIGAVVVAVAAGIALRFFTTSDLWLDEALTVNIASLSLSEQLNALRRDGAPPLFYLLLHGWTRLFGTGDLAVRSLSGLLGVAALPLAWAAGARVGGRQVAVAALVLVATSPFAIRYSTEARMYALVMVLVLAGYLCLRASLDRPAPARLLGLASASGLLLLTQYWAFYLLAAVAAVLAVMAWRRPAAARRPSLASLAAAAAGGLLFVPWLPHFLYQLNHTGTPWGTPPNPVALAITTAVDWGGGAGPEARLLTIVLAGLAVLGLFGRAAGSLQVQLDLRTERRVRGEAAVVVVTLAIGAVAGLLTASAFASRYTSIVLPLGLLVAAAGVQALADRRAVAAVLTIAAVLGLAGGARNVVTNRTQAGQVAEAIERHGTPGDVVVYCPDQVAPDVARLLPDGFRQLTFPIGAGPGFVDWVDYEARHRAAEVEPFADQVVAMAGAGAVFHVWTPGYRTLGDKCERLNDMLTVRSARSEQLVTSDPAFFEHHNLTFHDPR